MSTLQLETPRVFLPLLRPARYKGAHGGRGSGKSHFFAEMLLERCVLEPTRAVCVREVQKSLKQSVMRLLEDKIKALGLTGFEVLVSEIRTPHDGLIVFQGMQDHTSDSIKSLEGFDVAWVEEAQSLSQRSLDLLRPTIRKPGSELWFTWNPRHQTDPIDALLRAGTTPPDAVVVEANFRDNPWFPDVLRAEMEWDRARDPEKYAHIWLGAYEQLSEARVFKNWRVEEFETPTDAVFYFGADWGFSTDPTVLVRAFLRGPRTLCIDAEVYQVGCEIDHTPALFDRLGDGLARKWRIVADSARPETIAYMQRHGYPRIEPARKGPGSLEEGITFLQSYDLVVHPRCTHAIDELTFYRYKTDKLTGAVLPVLQDKKNHCIAEGQRVLTARGLVPIEQVTTADHVMTRSGWRSVVFAGLTDVQRQVVRVETTIGTLICTPDHEIFNGSGFVRADTLRYNDEAWGDALWWRQPSGTATPTAAIPALLKDGRNGATSSATSTTAPSTCTALSGLLRMARSLRARISITATEIPRTTPSPTLSACSQLNTLSAIRTAKVATTGSDSSWTRFDRSPRLGTPAQKVGANISALAHWRTATSSRRLSPASSAVQRSHLGPWATAIGSAVAHASLQLVGRLASTMRRVSAQRAEDRFQPIGTAQPAPVVGRVRTVSAHGAVARVYDLTVEGAHEFFVEGVLVHNCIDAIRYAIEPLRKPAGGSGQMRDPITHTPALNSLAGRRPSLAGGVFGRRGGLR